MPFRPASIFIHPHVQRDYDDLDREAARGRQPAAAVWKSVHAAWSRVRADGQWGEVIPKRAIPRHFVKTYGVTNLYCVDLAKFHRAFYTIVGRDVVFLDIVDHGRYDKLFGIKGK